MIVRLAIVALCLGSIARAAEPPPLTFGRPHVCSGDYYPADAVKLHHEGTVTLSFTITEQGTVTDPTIVHSSGYPELDAAALACVPSWRYRPATQNGKPAAVLWKAQVKFDQPSPEEMQRHLAVDQAMRALENEASRCLYAALAARAVAPEFDGVTQISIRFHAASAAEVSSFASSGNQVLDDMAVACFQDAPSLRQVRSLMPDGREYHLYVRWKDVLQARPAVHQ
jgi:TonB family protein